MKTTFTILILVILLSICSYAQNQNTTLIGHWGYGPCYTSEVVNDLVYMGSGCMFLVIDISNPSQPEKIGELLLAGVLRDITIVGDHAYIAAGEEGLRIINISNPSTSYEVGSCNLPSYAERVAISGNFAYVIGTSYLRIINISNLEFPFEESCYVFMQGIAMDIALSGIYAYVVAGYYGLHIIDISDPVAPNEIASYDTPGGAAWGIAVSGSFAYITDITEGLFVIDISEPSDPFEVALYNTDNYTIGISIFENYA